MGGINASIRRDGFIKINPTIKSKVFKYILIKIMMQGYYLKARRLIQGRKLAITDMDYEIGVGAGVYTDIVSKVE